jgi:hypothetical protein
MAERPTEKHITYHLEYRKCADPSCGICRMGPGHGPSWYASWYHGSELSSLSIGPIGPASPETPMESWAPENILDQGQIRPETS